MLITGEPGKTVNIKKVIQYMALVAAGSVSEELVDTSNALSVKDMTLEEMIVAANLVMEALVSVTTTSSTKSSLARSPG